MMTSTSGQCAKPRTVLTKEQAIDIFRLSASGYTTASGPTATSVARAFGVSEKTIRDIWKGRTWCDETLPLDSSRQPKPRKKTGRPMGRKDSAPRRPKQTPRQPKLIPKRKTRPQDSRAVSDDSPQALLISKPNAKSQDGANVVTTGATRLLPDHSPQNLRLLSCDSLPKGPWKRDSVTTSLHPFRYSASIDGGTLLTARPWPVLIPPADPAPPRAGLLPLPLRACLQWSTIPASTPHCMRSARDCIRPASANPSQPFLARPRALRAPPIVACLTAGGLLEPRGGTGPRSPSGPSLPTGVRHVCGGSVGSRPWLVVLNVALNEWRLDRPRAPANPDEYKVFDCVSRPSLRPCPHFPPNP